jgi:uncharacterized RDD family membrane protein YckC
MTESGAPGDQGAPGAPETPSAPQPPAAPPGGGWSAPAAPPPVPGAAGFVYADVLYRVIAIIIDAIIIGIVIAIIQAVLSGIGLNPYSFALTGGFSVNIIGLLLYVVIGVAVSLGYFTLMWTSRRATVGMQVLGMQVGSAPDGKTLTQDQAIRRWLALFGPSTAAQLFYPLSFLGWLIGLAAFAWVIFLLWTTYSSPTKQGWHDHFVNSMVVKAARIAG